MYQYQKLSSKSSHTRVWVNHPFASLSPLSLLLLPPHLKEWCDPSLRPAVLVGIILEQEGGYIGVAFPASHEEGTLAVVVGRLHVSTGLQEQLGHTHVPFPS